MTLPSNVLDGPNHNLKIPPTNPTTRRTNSVNTYTEPHRIWIHLIWSVIRCFISVTFLSPCKVSFLTAHSSAIFFVWSRYTLLRQGLIIQLCTILLACTTHALSYLSKIYWRMSHLAIHTHKPVPVVFAPWNSHVHLSLCMLQSYFDISLCLVVNVLTAIERALLTTISNPFYCRVSHGSTWRW